MARTDATNVATLVEVDDTIDLNVFIESANVLVTELMTGDNAPDPEYHDTRLELIERWLAAHFYACRDRQAESEKAGSVSVKYMSKVELSLDVTIYGQQAQILDTAGKLAALKKQTNEGTRTKVGATWLGTEHD